MEMGTRKNRVQKMTKREVREWGYDVEGVAYCLHCDQEIKVIDVVENPRGDWCPTPGCSGALWGKDLFPDPWWREKEKKEIFEDTVNSLR